MRQTYALGPQSNPAASVSLRAIDPERYIIVNEAEGGAVMEEIEESKAFYEVYDGAVYMYQVSCLSCACLSTSANLCLSMTHGPFAMGMAAGACWHGWYGSSGVLTTCRHTYKNGKGVT